eukprot:1093121-Amphidinium_carterae.1
MSHEPGGVYSSTRQQLLLWVCCNTPSSAYPPPQVLSDEVEQSTHLPLSAQSAKVSAHFLPTKYLGNRLIHTTMLMQSNAMLCNRSCYTLSYFLQRRLTISKGNRSSVRRDVPP